jgi:hypothetical protein
MVLGFALVAAALAGEPALKGSKLVVDGKPVLEVKTQKMMGTSATTVTQQGVEVVVFSLAPYPPDQLTLAADFSSVGKTFGVQLPQTTPGDVLVGWWNAGVLTTQGADLGALEKWCAERQITLNDTAEEQEKFDAYVATHPGPVFDPPPSSSSSSSGPEGPAAAPAPGMVSVQLHISCGENVRLFFGASPTSGGTYGWESPNSTRSASMDAGSVVCICDASDHVQSCWTASGSSARLDVGCGQLMAQ